MKNVFFESYNHYYNWLNIPFKSDNVISGIIKDIEYVSFKGNTCNINYCKHSSFVDAVNYLADNIVCFNTLPSSIKSAFVFNVGTYHFYLIDKNYLSLVLNYFDYNCYAKAYLDGICYWSEFN